MLYWQTTIFSSLDGLDITVAVLILDNKIYYLYLSKSQLHKVCDPVVEWTCEKLVSHA